MEVKSLEMLPGLVYIKDSQSVIEDCNSHFASCLGYADRSEVIGLSMDELAWNEKTAKRMTDNDRAVTDNGGEHTEEEPLKRKDGSVVRLLTSKRSLTDDQGNITGVLCIAHDVTRIRKQQMDAEKEKEAAVSANQAKSAFLACMSHDLRTPLNAVYGMAQILRTQNLLPPHQELVNDILSSCQILHSLVDDILNLSKIESNQLEFAEEPIDLRLIGNEVVAHLNFLAEQKNIALILAYNDEVPRFLVGDARRIKQVLMNLIGNAIKFTQDGQILLAIEPIDITPAHVEFQIAVEDTGIGISDEKINSIFDTYYQVEDSGAKHEGVGLGLSIVEHLVSKMDGGIQVNSQPGKGATFWCSLKLKRQPDTKQRSAWEAVAHNFNVLVVDNHARRAEFIETLVGTKNIVHADQETALSLLQNQNPDKPFLIALIHDKILSYDKHFLKAFLDQCPDSKPKVVAYGRLTSDAVIKNKQIDEFLAMPIHDVEIIGILLSLHKKVLLEKQNNVELKLENNKIPRILVVEDNPLNQKVVKILLTNHGCDVEIAQTGSEAKKKALNGNPFDMIFVDFGLPDISGLDVSRDLLKNEKFDKNIPIIAMTGNGTEEDVKKALDAGMRELLTKPVCENELVQILVKYMS